MLFREISIEDKEQICDILCQSQYMGCEYSFANNMAWRRLYNSEICFYKGCYIVGSQTETEMRLLYPAGSNALNIIDDLRKYSAENGKSLALAGVTEPTLQLLQEKFSGQFTTRTAEDSGDYIYNADDLLKLEGKKYHKKRGHLKKFQQYNWQFVPIQTQEDMDACIPLSVKKFAEDSDHSSTAEQFAIHTFFTNWEALELKGGRLIIDGETVAFTIGSQINDVTFGVHIEKANTEYEGVYAAINNEFVKFVLTLNPKVKYFNREEDLGLEGLRKSKLSYYPAFILQKNIVKFKEY